MGRMPPEPLRPILEPGAVWGYPLPAPSFPGQQRIGLLLGKREPAASSSAGSQFKGSRQEFADATDELNGVGAVADAMVVRE